MSKSMDMTADFTPPAPGTARLSWAARAFLFLASQPEGPFVSILDVPALAREDPSGSKDSGVNPLKGPCEGLLVFPMETAAEGLEFGKVCPHFIFFYYYLFIFFFICLTD